MSRAQRPKGKPLGPSTDVRQVGALVVNDADHSLRVDVSKLEAPTKTYDADAAWIEHRPGHASLIFCKIGRDAPQTLKSRLEIRYPPEDLIRTFWNISQTFIVALREYADKWPADARAHNDVSDWPAETSHSEWASFTYISHSGTEGAIDFYHLSTAGLARYAQSGATADLRPRPVVRVQLTTFEILDLFDSVEPVVEDIKTHLPGQHRDVQPVEDTEAEDPKES